MAETGGAPPPGGPGFWNDRYRATDFAYGLAPSRYLAEHRGLIRPGLRTLVPADGEGRNGVWLAEQGADVLSVDFAESGLAKAAARARSRGVALRTRHADLAAWTPPEGAFDLIVCIYLHLPPAIRRGVHAGFVQALAPGGHLLLEGFTVDQLNYASGGPRDPAMLFTAGSLREEFAGLDALECREEVVDLDEGAFHRGPGALIRYLGRKPGGGIGGTEVDGGGGVA